MNNWKLKEEKNAHEEYSLGRTGDSDHHETERDTK
jgi:hypothetical protein